MQDWILGGLGDVDRLGAPDPAEQAARQAIEDDADDWRGHAALAQVLAKRGQGKEAAVAARRAVALAPEEPEAHLALADALAAVFPRPLGTRAAVLVELDRAELLGVPADELTERRAKSPSFALIIGYSMSSSLFWGIGLRGDEGAIGVAIAWPAMIALLAATIVVRIRPRGGSLREALRLRREVSRQRMPTDEQVSQRAPRATVFLVALSMPTAFLAVPGADGNAPSQAGAWAALITVPAAALALWIGMDRWLRPGTVIRVLRHDPFVAGSVAITLALATTTSMSAILEVQRPGVWFALYLAQMGWAAVGAVCGFRIAARRKKKAEET